MLDVLDFIADRGGDAQKVRESQRRRYADEGIVDEVIALYEDARTSMLLTS
jgi:seryl-tRNA synthetase